MVRLESIKIERFRGIREGEITGFTDVNLIIGRNNCGKSTVAEAISRIGDGTPWRSMDPLRRPLDDLWHRVRGEGDGTAPAELWYRRNQDQPAVIEGVIPAVAVRMELGLGGHITNSARNLAADHQVVPFVKSMALFHPSDTNEREIELQLWGRLLGPRHDKRLIRALNDIFGFEVEQLQLPPDGRMVVVFPQHALSLDVQGDGTRAALRCLLLLAVLEKTLLILEEPESHQHPGSLERFAKALCEMAKNQEVQLLITTHSIECVKAFLTATSEAQSESAVFHLTLEDGLLDSRRLDQETVEKLIESGVDVRNLDLYA